MSPYKLHNAVYKSEYEGENPHSKKVKLNIRTDDLAKYANSLEGQGSFQLLVFVIFINVKERSIGRLPRKWASAEKTCRFLGPRSSEVETAMLLFCLLRRSESR